jgi:hypothetical protein
MRLYKLLLSSQDVRIIHVRKQLKNQNQQIIRNSIHKRTDDNFGLLTVYTPIILSAHMHCNIIF